MAPTHPPTSIPSIIKAISTKRICHGMFLHCQLSMTTNQHPPLPAFPPVFSFDACKCHPPRVTTHVDVLCGCLCVWGYIYIYIYTYRGEGVGDMVCMWGGRHRGAGGGEGLCMIDIEDKVSAAHTIHPHTLHAPPSHTCHHTHTVVPHVSPTTTRPHTHHHHNTHTVVPHASSLLLVSDINCIYTTWGAYNGTHDSDSNTNLWLRGSSRAAASRYLDASTRLKEPQRAYCVRCVWVWV